MTSKHKLITSHTRLKVGDVFMIQCADGIRCFQFIANDRTQMSSNVIAAFAPLFASNALPDMDSIAKSNVLFVAHCIIKLGLRLSCWSKLGNAPVSVDTSALLFRDSSDYGNKSVTKSVSWWVWKISEPQVFVGPLQGMHQQAHIGLVFPPKDIVQWACAGGIEIGGYPSY